MTDESKPYTEEQYKRFKNSVNMTGSNIQVARIKARLYINALIRDLGGEVCDAMFERMKAEDPNPETLEGRK